MDRHSARVVLVAALLSSCTAAPTVIPTSSPTTGTPSPFASNAPSATPNPTSTPAPAVVGEPFPILPGSQPTDMQRLVTCDGSIGPNDPVALVILADPGEEEPPTVLVDFADGTPRRVCELPGTGYPLELLDATHAVIVGGTDAETFDDTLAVVELPAARYQWFQVPDGGEDVITSFVAVSPNRDAITWLRWDTAAGIEEVHLTTASGDAVLESYALEDGGRCGTIEDSQFGSFSPSGTYGFVLRQPVAQQNTLLVFEGSDPVLTLEPSDGTWAEGRHPAMALWAPSSDTLYYRKGANVYRWQPGSDPAVFLDGVRWYDPTFSADGRWLAYATHRSDEGSDVYLLDLRGAREPVRIGPGGQPIFVSPTLVWYKSETAACAGPEAQPRLYDVSTGTESATDIVAVRSAWPGTSSR